MSVVSKAEQSGICSHLELVSIILIFFVFCSKFLFLKESDRMFLFSGHVCEISIAAF